MLADATSAIRFDQLGLSPIALDLGFFKIRWYSLAYIVGIVFGWWYLLKLIEKPGAPLAKRHVDDFVFFATLGVILGGRLGYILFYRPDLLLHPLEALKLWEGGMSFHGGVIGVSLAIFWFCRKNGLSWLRVHDYIACVYPVGHLLGRLANFVNGELWGRETDVSWGMIFPDAGNVVRHPSQLYQAGSEGLLLFIILFYAFWRTEARYEPGKLVGLFIGFMGLFRFIGEFYREPDVGIYGLFGMTMGQTLCIPMILGGLYLVWTAKGRRQRVESFAGTNSIA
jgi:phosphatidylglycerol---prolipoprotein diacylglyceryl transferase